MNIERIDVVPLLVPAEPRPAAVPAMASPMAALHQVFVKVTTDTGLVGWGECLCYRPPMQRSLIAALHDVVLPHYAGQAVETRAALNLGFRRRHCWQGRAGVLMNALAAVDLALWDIAGKAAGRPLAAMLANELGTTAKATVPVMASLDRYGEPDKAAVRVGQALAAGVAAVKVHEADLAVIERARGLIPRNVPFVADVNNAFDLAGVAAELGRWQALELLWLEDPVWPPEALLGHPGWPGVTVGLGADLGSSEQMLLYASSEAVGVVQPDLCMIGGLSEGLRLTAAARALPRKSPVGIAPHTPFLGPAALASIHLMAALDQVQYFATIEADEAMDPYDIGLARWQPAVAVPTAPGLGHDPRADYVKRYAMT